MELQSPVRAVTSSTNAMTSTDKSRVARPCIVYCSNIEENGSTSLKQATSLFGRVVHDISGNNNTDHVVALTESGVFNLNTDKIITNIEFIQFVCGYNHCVGSTGVFNHTTCCINPIVSNDGLALTSKAIYKLLSHEKLYMKLYERKIARKLVYIPNLVENMHKLLIKPRRNLFIRNLYLTVVNFFNFLINCLNSQWRHIFLGRGSIW